MDFRAFHRGGFSITQHAHSPPTASHHLIHCFAEGAAACNHLLLDRVALRLDCRLLLA